MEPLNVWRRDPASAPAQLLAVLCHGVGADGSDLIGLADVWAKTVPQAAFIAPDAPEPCDMAPMGRQWFSLQDRTPSVLEAGARRAAPTLRLTVKVELERRSLPRDALILIGFSQGAMMVLHAGLRWFPPPRGIVAFSGAMLDNPSLEREITGHPPVLLVHGQEDQVVPFACGPAAERTLRRLGVPTVTEWLPGVGHWIGDAGLVRAALFLKQVSGQ